MLVYSLLERGDSLAYVSRLHLRHLFGVDLHAAVDAVYVREKLCLGDTWDDGGSVLGFSVVREYQVLEKDRLLFRHSEPFGGDGNLLRPHHEVTEKLSLRRVIGDKSERGRDKLAVLRHVVQERAGDQQVAVDDLGVQPGEEIGELHHVRGVHQQTVQEGVMERLRRREIPEAVGVAREEIESNLSVILVLNRVYHLLDLSEGLAGGDRRGRDEFGDVVLVVRVGETDERGRELTGALEFSDLSADLDDLSDIVLVSSERTRVVPDLEINNAGGVRQRSGEERLPVRRCADGRVLQDVESLDIVARSHVGDGYVVFEFVWHVWLPLNFFSYIISHPGKNFKYFS